ncbi:MAG: IS5 family transposase [Thermodesulfobacteriota bacterium]
MTLTNEQWELIATLIPPAKSGGGGKGRPAREPRDVVDGVLWILRTGAPWEDLPERFPPHQTCRRWLQRWRRDGVFDRILIALAEDLRERGGIDLREAFIDGTFAPAKKGALGLGKPSGAKAARSWQWQTLAVFLSPCTWPALRRMK